MTAMTLTRKASLLRRTAATVLTALILSAAVACSSRAAVPGSGSTFLMVRAGRGTGGGAPSRVVSPVHGYSVQVNNSSDPDNHL